MTNQTQQSPSTLKARRHIKTLVGTSTFIHSYRAIDEDEYEYGRRDRSLSHDRIESDRHVWNILAGDIDEEYRPQAMADILKIESVDELCDAINIALSDGDWSCGPSYVETSEQFEARRANERRQKLEAAASEIAIRYKCEVSSIEFIAACHSELERFNDYRRGMREDGLCIGYGVSYEQWSEEFNASQGDTNDVHDVLGWLRTKCPLLWAQYEESLLAAKRAAEAEKAFPEPPAHIKRLAGEFEVEVRGKKVKGSATVIETEEDLRALFGPGEPAR